MPKSNLSSSRTLRQTRPYFSLNEAELADALYAKSERDLRKLRSLPAKKMKIKRSASESMIKCGDENVLNKKKITKSKSSRNLNAIKVRVFISNKNTIKLYDSVPSDSMPPLHITNQDEVKKLFFESKIPPVLKFKADDLIVQNMLTKHSKPGYAHFFKAKHILDVIKAKYPLGLQQYFNANFGKRISSKECVSIVSKYLADNKIFGDISVNFAPGLTCSGRITSYNLLKNKPETRKFVIWINDGEENQFLRQNGIIALCDHEIGTHYYRSFNDGLQIWYSDRKKFDLRSLNSVELLKTEEGIAALHTVMNANLKYLLLPALLYYLACMADRMTFEQLYNHMETYIESAEERWKLVTRVKRGISDPHMTGCYSRDQSYFEGAIEILENLDKIDFTLLMSGKICLDELDRVRKIARLDNIKLPKFFENIDEYKGELRNIGVMNGLIEEQKRTASCKAKNKSKERLKRDVIISDLDDNYTIEENDEEEEEEDVDKEITNLYELNSRKSNLSANQIKTYINHEIVANTKSSLEVKPNLVESHSSVCLIL